MEERRRKLLYAAYALCARKRNLRLKKPEKTKSVARHWHARAVCIWRALRLVGRITIATMPWLLKLACLVLACDLTVHSSVTSGGGGDAIARLPPAVRMPAGGWLPEIRRTPPAAALTMPASTAQAAAPARSPRCASSLRT